MAVKKLNYNEMLEKLLGNYYEYNKQEAGLIGKALSISRKRTIIKKTFKLLNKEYNEEFGAELITKAFWYAKKKHAKQKRFSGEPYFVHPYYTALYLTELKMDAPSIAAGFLHDVVEDTETELSEIKDNFGKEVAELVNSLTKLKHIVAMSRKKEHNISFQNLLFSTTKDVRVIIIKLADKHHNVRTLNFLPEEKQVRIATNVLEFYVPLAKKLGMHELRDSFEQACFKIVKPKIYSKIKKKAKDRAKKKEIEMNLMIKKLESELKKADLNVSFSKYKRTIYTIFKKMTQNLKSFNEVQDCVVLIALAENREQCYEFLGILHSIFSPIPLKFRDHIAISQFALYKSIHTTVIGPMHSPIKVYIRTREMDALVRNGVAEFLRESKIDTSDFHKNISFLNNLLSINFDDLSAEHFVDVLKTDYLQERILVFTPKGNLIELPRGASVIDFAYTLDKDIGNRARKARVNGKIVPIWEKLKNGDLVEVLTTKKIRVSKVWKTFAISVKARNEIQKHLKIKKEKKHKMPLVSLEFRAIDRPGLVNDFTRTFLLFDANIFSADIRTADESRIGRDSFTIEVSDPKKLEKLLKKLRKIKGVVEIKSSYIE